MGNSLQITSQEQGADKLRIQAEFLRERPLQPGHAYNFNNTDQIHYQKHRQYQKRRKTPAENFPHQAIGGKQECDNMNPCQKKKHTVNPNAKQSIYGIYKAMHPFWIHLTRKRLSLHKAIDPFMMGIHVTRPISRILKHPIGKIYHTIDKQTAKEHIFPEMILYNAPKAEKLLPGPLF